ncbi:hypothetical protein Pmani_031206 [Petrolisthes manimaculis]|uniref:Uncharacterized protein n=1 Tax=Petrolisthes manimaculis TaxID=1843537 RepID=A0AAE1NW49_9EUCA|nr:hypothetical protein Pmani_031206 [Petrolisthes manimaculis]
MGKRIQCYDVVDGIKVKGKVINVDDMGVAGDERLRCGHINKEADQPPSRLLYPSCGRADEKDTRPGVSWEVSIIIHPLNHLVGERSWKCPPALAPLAQNIREGKRGCMVEEEEEEEKEEEDEEEEENEEEDGGEGEGEGESDELMEC